MKSTLLLSTTTSLLILGSFNAPSLNFFASAHEPQEKKDPNEPWQVWHMREEHGIDDFDPLSFFTLHDLDGSGTWTPNDVLNLYGLLNDKIVGDGTGMGEHKDTADIPKATKEIVLKSVLGLVDYNKDGIISQDEWKQFSDSGNVLPDFGLGPGHHGDYEYEYEVHHWLKYHAENDPDVKIVHQEDIDHEKLYHAHEHQDEPDSHVDQEPEVKVVVVRPLAFGAINERNIPQKYLQN